MSKVRAMKRDYKKTVEKQYNDLAEQLYDGKRHPKEVCMDMLAIVKSYFDSMRELNARDPWFDMDIIAGVISDRKDYKTYQQNYRIGCFIFALTRLGSTARQAQMATAKFLDCSEPTCKRASALFRKRKTYEEDISAKQFIYLTAHHLEVVLAKAVKEFPASARYKKAKIAYDSLLPMLKKSQKQKDKFIG